VGGRDAPAAVVARDELACARGRLDVGPGQRDIERFARASALLSAQSTWAKIRSLSILPMNPHDDEQIFDLEHMPAILRSKAYKFSDTL
jgi:hypothetical protein